MLQPVSGREVGSHFFFLSRLLHPSPVFQRMNLFFRIDRQWIIIQRVLDQRKALLALLAARVLRHLPEAFLPMHEPLYPPARGAFQDDVLHFPTARICDLEFLHSTESPESLSVPRLSLQALCEPLRGRGLLCRQRLRRRFSRPPATGLLLP